MDQNSAIVLAMFGTTVESALPGLLNIESAMEAAFPLTPVRMAFTSPFIRKTWRKRSLDPLYREAQPYISQEVLKIQGPLATIANFQDEGYGSIVVQSVHIAPAEEYTDLANCLHALCSIKGSGKSNGLFDHLVLGRPALGANGALYAYGDDIRVVATALKEDIDLASASGAALVYMGHGNSRFSSAGYYLELAARMNQYYPDTLTCIGTVEGYPSLADVIAILHGQGVKKVLLKPLMVVAGNHALKDMLKDSEHSWQSTLEREGFTVNPVVRGLGELEAFADIFVQHANEAARDVGMVLK